jgi:hypothetical protein
MSQLAENWTNACADELDDTMYIRNSKADGLLPEHGKESQRPYFRYNFLMRCVTKSPYPSP